MQVNGAAGGVPITQTLPTGAGGANTQHLVPQQGVSSFFSFAADICLKPLQRHLFTLSLPMSRIIVMVCSQLSLPLPACKRSWERPIQGGTVAQPSYTPRETCTCGDLWFWGKWEICLAFEKQEILHFTLTLAGRAGILRDGGRMADIWLLLQHCVFGIK